METGTLNERIQIYEPKAERNLSGLSDDCLIRWNGRFYGIDNLSADKHKGEILLGCSYSGLNDNQRITT